MQRGVVALYACGAWISVRSATGRGCFAHGIWPETTILGISLAVVVLMACQLVLGSLLQ